MTDFVFPSEMMSISQFMITNCDFSIGILHFLFAFSTDDNTKFFATLCTLDKCPHEKTCKTKGSNAWSFKAYSSA